MTAILFSRRTAWAAALAASNFVATAPAAAAPVLAAPPAGMDVIPAWVATRGHAQPIVAIVGENGGTELTDFAIPYGVLKRAGIDAIALAAHEGPVRFRPALRAQLDGTLATFDARHPEGADYVIVPALVNPHDAAVRDWLVEQARKGATVVSICDGALVVADAGLLAGKWATAHWASESQRLAAFPNTHWVRNARYVVDGRVVSSAGISAAMPTSLALVAAISGRDRADALARDMGVPDWSARHDSEVFRPHFGNFGAFAVKLAINPLLHARQTIGVPLAPGMDEITLAVTADAYSRTGRSQAMAMSATDAPVPSRFGLRFLPDVVGATRTVDIALPALADVPPGAAFDAALAAIGARYGRRTAYGVALDFEYPGFLP